MAEAVSEATAQPAAKATAPPLVASDSPFAKPAKRSNRAAWVLGGMAVAGGGLLMLVVGCAGIIAFASMHRSGGSAVNYDDGKGGPSAYTPDYSYSSAKSDDGSKGGSSDYSPSYGAKSGATYSDPYTSAPAADEKAEAAAQSEKARREEEQRQANVEYWARRDEEEAAAREDREEAAERYRESFREAQRQLQAYP